VIKSWQNPDAFRALVTPVIGYRSAGPGWRVCLVPAAEQRAGGRQQMT
jgi:hypothetical protein